MRKAFQLLRRIPKPLRIFFDLLLAALLFFAWFIARGGPRYSEEERFRRAEKANLVGPSVLLDKTYVQGDWIPTHYNRLLIGDSGDEILFYTLVNGRRNTEMDGALIRRDKSDGILLTPLPGGVDEPVSGVSEPLVIPLFLFVDDPAAVRAEVRLKLPDKQELRLSQVRGEDRAGENEGWYVKEQYFLFRLAVSPELWNSPDNQNPWQALVRTNQLYSKTWREVPAEILLYDGEDRLMETREYVIRSRVAEGTEE